MKHTCPKCGHEHDINPAQMLGAIRTPKKEAAWKRNGANLKKLLEAGRKSLGGRVEMQIVGTPFDPPEAPKPFGRLVDGDTRVMPKGSLSKEDLKDLIACKGMKTLKVPDWIANASLGDASLQNVPAAPFDLNIEGEPHRVRQIGKKLMLVYLGGDGEIPVRPLAEGELESMWEKRIQ